MKHLHELQEHYGPGEGRALYRMVMEDCFGLTHTDIVLGKDNEISAEQQNRLDEITARLLKNEPIQYILKQATFCGRVFEVGPGVLIPRPETEVLVATALECAKRLPQGRRHSLLDIGTGSGCIAITLALESDMQVSAIDISAAALDIARKNARQHTALVDFQKDDILAPQQSEARWDIIASNPPYICLSEALEMEPNVLMHEPHQALFVPDTDPLLFYRAIASYALSHLNPNGWLCLEINRAFGQEIRQLLSSFGFHNIEIIDDQYGNARIATAQL